MKYIDFHTHHIPDETDVEAVVDGRDTWGIHPWRADEPFAVPELKGKIAIGECGLDAVRGPLMEVQEQVFLQQIRLSEETKKPLVIHCVKALDALLSLRRNLHPAMPWMFHGFRGKPQQLRSLLDAGFFVSFGSNSNDQSLLRCPLERLMLETDDSTRSIAEIYNNVAMKRGLDIATLCDAMAENYQTFFQKEPILI